MSCPTRPPTSSSAVTLMGIDPTLHAHPALTFRLLVNAIYSALD